MSVMLFPLVIFLKVHFFFALVSLDTVWQQGREPIANFALDIFLPSAQIGLFRIPSYFQFESTGLGLSSSRLRTTLNRIQESLIDLVSYGAIEI